ncbi:DUF4058 family protein [Cronbergia sp. UHCC 0137]|uniref:DUF4058 family protein n=1 Tax=Cronbergia sp. UHCC 0137 TaxID=3110239 RepID=UPI002B1F6CFF|nr:DUF4058 family protein [Cronbergia sp. UHCC 0137]MEA5617871.1 DUF4058 family protein [Cronbergia sp. UHCC 0137]
MPSPFPGMNPYLEGYLWPDVHSALANKIRQILVPKLRPKYTARLEIYLVEDTTPEGEIGILYPDVEVLQVKQKYDFYPPSQVHQSSVLTTPAPLTLPILQPVTVRVPTIEIRDTANNTLVTSIEILSPVNKREPGLTQYRQKRQRLYNANVHLIEIDLLRRGTRPFQHPHIPDVSYLISLIRAYSGVVNIWTIKLQDRLPIIPIPLHTPDTDIALDLQDALHTIFDEAAYDLSIDYNQLPPPPPINMVDAEWIQTLLKT